MKKADLKPGMRVAVDGTGKAVLGERWNSEAIVLGEQGTSGPLLVKVQNGWGTRPTPRYALAVSNGGKGLEEEWTPYWLPGINIAGTWEADQAERARRMEDFKRRERRAREMAKAEATREAEVTAQLRRIGVEPLLVRSAGTTVSLTLTADALAELLDLAEATAAGQIS